MPPDGIVKALESPELAAFLRRLDHRLLRVTAGSPDFNGPVSRLVHAGGKRLRPALAFLAARATGAEPNDRVMAAAATVELTHLASIVHDDVIDKSLERRGQPTTARQQGTGAALLTGDYLLSRAFAEAAIVGAPAVSWLSDAVTSMAEGVTRESSDREAPGKLDQRYFEIARLKTGVLFGLACQLGGSAAGLQPHKVTRLQRYGESFGIAFQIIDDCLDGYFKEQFDAEIESARRYIQMALDELGGLPPEPAAAALRRLPDLYLASTLGH